ncbi:MAG: CxxC-x17-CxxC domain-containing protein [Candidatus Nealsonbacteria bacterium]
MFNDFKDRPRRSFGERQMFKGNWKCADCSKEITELPFEPSEDRPIYCRECHAKRRPPRRDFRR